MLWPLSKKKQQTKDQGEGIFGLIRINDRIGLESEGSSYVTRIEDIRPDEMDVASPVGVSGEGIRLGRKIVLCLYLQKGLHRFSAAIKCITTDRVPLLVLHNFVDLGKVEQRNYERVKDQLPLHFRSEIGMGSTAPWCTGTTRDISGGGAHVLTDEATGLAAGVFLEIELFLPADKSVRALARVVRVGRAHGSRFTYSLALRFAQIRDTDRALIVKHTHARAAALESDRRGVVRSRQQVAVKYRPNDSGKVENWINGGIQDVSTGGIRMVVGDTSELAVGKGLDVRLAIPNKGEVIAQCQVVWIRPNAQVTGGGFQIGLKYAKISPQAQAELAAFVAKAQTEGRTDWQDAA
jgi:c-di-GMP-binding flagellar brake protein YcgR